MVKTSRLSILTFLLISCLLLQTTPAQASISTGDKCTKAGRLQQVKFMTYACTKVQGTLVWRPRENAKEIASSPVIKYFNSEFKKFRTKIPNTDVSNLYTLETEESTKSYLWTKDSINSISTSINLISALGVVPTSSIKFVNFWNAEWARPLLPDWCFIGSGGGACGNQNAYTNLKWFADSGNHSNTNPNVYQDETQKFLITANLPHEIGHIAQGTLREMQGDLEAYRNDQAWYREGGAELTKVFWYAHTNNVTYSFARNLYIKNMDIRCKSVSLTALSSSGSTERGCEYNVGFLALEYLLWKIKDIKALYRNYANLNSRTTFGETFEVTYGLDFKKFVEEADKYVKEQRI